MKSLADLLKIEHSITDGHINHLTGSVAAGGHEIPHELVGAPDIVFQMPGSSPNIVPGSNEKSLLLSAAESGAYDYLLVNKHSLWGEGQWNSFITSVPPEGVTAIPHGLIRVPNVVALGGRTGADVAVADVEADDKNVYIANHSKASEQIELLVVAVHSIIDVPEEK